MKTQLHSAFRIPHSALLLVLALAAARPGLAGPNPLTVLHHFNGSDGKGPLDGLAWGLDGNFYGATQMGGNVLDPQGTLYSISPAGAYAQVYEFGNDAAGFTPYAKPAPLNGKLLGTSNSGGTGMAGAVFRVNPASLSYDQTYDFTGGFDGGFPEGALIQASDGNFYGTTTAGGTNGSGCVFQLNPVTFAISNVYSFTDGLDGRQPRGALVQGTDGNFYGTTEHGGFYNYGTIFVLGISKGGPGGDPPWSLTNLFSFTDHADGAYPNGGLVQGLDGLLYGTTSYGGDNPAPSLPGGGGTIYSINPATAVLISIYSFGDDHPQPLMQATDGNFYSTTTHGSGVEPHGTIFRLTPDGVISTLWTFSGTNGSNPSGALVQYSTSAQAGHLLGTTSDGGTNGFGTVFSFAANLPLTYKLKSPMSFGTGGFNVNLVSSAGATLQLQSVASLGMTNWANAGSPMPGSGGLVTLTDPGAAGQPQRFYRVAVTLPAIQ
jgi:uncharacterized repeat protein (TIGR03803 family)